LGGVPYTGATTNVNLGSYGLSSSYLISNYLELNYGYVSSSNNSARIGSNRTTYNEFYLNFGNGTTNLTQYLKFPLSTGYTYYFPEADGTLLLSSAISGTLNYVPKFTGTGATIGNSLIYDNGTNVGIGTASPSFKLDVSGTGRFTGQLTLGSTITNGTYTYTLPSATGTLALTSDLGAYLPLTGGTLSGQLSILRGSGTGLDVASDLVIFRASTGFGSPRQITLAAGNGPTTYLEAKGFGGNYITDFGIRTYNSSGTAFEVFFATSAGDVGIGNTAPAAKLDVNGTFKSVGSAKIGGGLNVTGYTNSSGANNWEIGSDASGYYMNALNRSSGNYNQPAYIDAQKLIINSGSAGNVGIGTSTFNYSSSGRGYLAVSGTSNAIIEMQNNGATAGYLYAPSGNFEMAAVGSTRYLTFTTNDAERMRITSGGQLMVGGTLGLQGRIVVFNEATGISIMDSSSNGGLMRFYNSNAVQIGSITTDASVTYYNTTSDYRLKEDLKEVKGLELVNKIKVYDYKWKSNDKRMDGVLAHELAEVLPYAVHGKKDGEDMQSVDYSKIVPILVKAVQEQQLQIEELKAKIK
jgi:hypothetical protein